jgi:predicted transcriptional regulator
VRVLTEEELAKERELLVDLIARLEEGKVRQLCSVLCSVPVS